ncbi:MAG TPA: hypothetical protein VGF55_01645 [Gemmataceae bacterium]
MSDQELAELAIELWKRFAARGQPIPALAIRGDDRKPIGFVVPAEGMWGPPSRDSKFLTESFHRIDNPPDRYLSVKEFLAAIGGKSVKKRRPKSVRRA